MNEDQTQKKEISKKTQSVWVNFILLIKIKLKKLFFKKKQNSHKNNLDHELVNKKLIYSLAPSKIPNFKQFKHIKKFLSSKEKRWINVAIFLIVISVGVLSWNFYQNNLEVVPSKGGSYSEGLVGSPKYINPLYAFSDVDSDLTYLIYSSLFKYNGKGEIAYDLIKDYEIREDGRVYLLEIKDYVYWHNGEQLNTDDIVFTINAIKNSDYQSPLRSIFSGVEVEKIDNYNVKLSLSETYTGFEELLTFGILPKDLWLNINPEYANLAEQNLMPIGSGPYKFDSLSKNKEGDIKEYKLIANEDYYKKNPYIKELNFKFYPNFISLNNALNEDEVDGISYISANDIENIIAQNSFNFHKLSIPQTTSIFFNQDNNSFLQFKKNRKALALAINKENILDKVFSQTVKKTNTPFLFDSFFYNKDIKEYGYNLDEAIKLLEENDFYIQKISQEDVDKINKQEERQSQKEEIENVDSNNDDADFVDKENLDSDSEDEEEGIFTIKGYQEIKSLSESLDIGLAGNWLYRETEGDDREYQVLTLTISNNEAHKELAQKIVSAWEKLGLKVSVNVIDNTDIQSQVIKPKEFEVLIYGQSLNLDPDPYVYWHSEKDFNIVNYNNEEVDKILEEARTILDKNKRKEKYDKFQEIVHEDIPAIFLYSSLYIYPQSTKIKGFDTDSILKPHHRFSNIINWYIKTKSKLVL